MRLETKIIFDSNLPDGTCTDWTAQLHRPDDDDETVFVQIIDKEGNVVFEMMLDELEHLCEALRIADTAELDVEEIRSKTTEEKP